MSSIKEDTSAISSSLSEVLDRILKWDSSMVEQFKLVYEQVVQLQWAIVLLILGILICTGYLSLIFLSEYYYHKQKQVWWQVLVFNSGLTINLLKVIYDIANVGAGFVINIKNFENALLHQNFSFDTALEKQFENIFNVHGSIVSKWLNKGGSIEIYGKKIDFDSIKKLIGVLLSQGFIFLFSYAYKHILKPFITA